MMGSVRYKLHTTGNAVFGKCGVQPQSWGTMLITERLPVLIPGWENPIKGSENNYFSFLAAVIMSELAGAANNNYLHYQ